MTTAILARVVVGVDLSAASGAAVGAAGALAAATGAALVVVHAETLDVPPYFTGSQIAMLEAERATARRAAEEYVREFVAAHTPTPAQVQVTEGRPVDVLLGATRGADVLVVGTDGQRGVRRWWLGSVAEAVVRASQVPVLVVRATSEGAAQSLFTTAGLRVLAAEPIGTTAARWLAVFRAACRARVSTLAGLPMCSREVLASSDLLVVSSRSDVVGPETAEVLRSCTHPVLFVPDDVSRP